MLSAASESTPLMRFEAVDYDCGYETANCHHCKGSNEISCLSFYSFGHVLWIFSIIPLCVDIAMYPGFKGTGSKFLNISGIVSTMLGVVSSCFFKYRYRCGTDLPNYDEKYLKSYKFTQDAYICLSISGAILNTATLIFVSIYF